MEKYKESEKVMKRVAEYNQGIDDFINLLMTLKVGKASVRDLTSKKDKLHAAFFKSNNAKLERLLEKLYDEYTCELADFIEAQGYRREID